MSKSPKEISRASKANYLRNVKKLQRAGLLDKVNLRVKRDLKARRAIIKYQDFLSGRAAAVKAPSAASAAHLSGKYKYKRRGSVLIIPKERHEKNIRVTKTGEIKSEYINPANRNETIHRTLGGKVAAPKEGQHLYYTIRERKRGLGTLKRTTFAKFDDLLEYLNAYEIDWDDVEPYFEVEAVGPRKAAKYDKTIQEERAAAHRRWYRRWKKKPKRGKIVRKSRVASRSKRKAVKRRSRKTRS